MKLNGSDRIDFAISEGANAEIILDELVRFLPTDIIDRFGEVLANDFNIVTDEERAYEKLQNNIVAYMPEEAIEWLIENYPEIADREPEYLTRCYVDYFCCEDEIVEAEVLGATILEDVAFDGAIILW